VVNLVKQNISKFQSVLPPDVKVSYEFDQSGYVKTGVDGIDPGGFAGRPFLNPA